MTYCHRKPHLNVTIKLLLERGADPNASSLPMPVLFFAIKAADTKAVEALLSKGADASFRLKSKVRFCFYNRVVNVYPYT